MILIISLELTLVDEVCFQCSNFPSILPSRFPYPFKRRQGGPQNKSGRFCRRKFSCPCCQASDQFARLPAT